MGVDIQELRGLLEGVGGGPIYGGCLRDPEIKCQCPYLFDSCHMGGIGEVYVTNGIPSLQNGGDDRPTAEAARAYMLLIIGAVNALPDLLDEVERARELKEKNVGD